MCAFSVFLSNITTSLNSKEEGNASSPLRLPFTTLIRHILDRERPHYREWCPKTWLDHNDLRFYISREANTERKSSLAASFLCGAFKCSLTVSLRSSPSWLDKAGRACQSCLQKSKCSFDSINNFLVLYRLISYEPLRKDFWVARLWKNLSAWHLICL